MESKCTVSRWGKEWRNSNGKFHRENDLPAWEGCDGYKEWFINGNRHRELGPAIIWSDGDEWWYLNGIEYFLEEMPIKLFMSYCNWEYKKKHG